MDVRAENRGRPHQNVRFSAADGEKLFGFGATGRKGQECPREIRTEKFMFMLFFFPNLGPATTQNLIVKFDGEICGGVLVENASDDFPQQKKLDNLLPNFAGSSPPISPKTSPTSLWKSLVPTNSRKFRKDPGNALRAFSLASAAKTPTERLGCKKSQRRGRCLRWAKSPIASVQRTRSTLAGHSAVPRGMNVTPMNANCAIRIAAQRTQGL